MRASRRRWPRLGYRQRVRTRTHTRNAPMAASWSAAGEVTACRSYRVATRRQFFSRQNISSIALRLGQSAGRNQPFPRRAASGGIFGTAPRASIARRTTPHLRLAQPIRIADPASPPNSQWSRPGSHHSASLSEPCGAGPWSTGREAGRGAIGKLQRPRRPDGRTPGHRPNGEWSAPSLACVSSPNRVAT
jgi:hypothetical protein